MGVTKAFSSPLVLGEMIHVEMIIANEQPREKARLQGSS